MFRPTLLLALAVTVLPAAALAQAGTFANLSRIDAEVAAFTGAPVGTPCGARHPVDRRLRMAECPGALALDWHGRRADMVRVECPALSGWQLFVPVNAMTGAAAAANSPARPAAPVVARGQVLTIAVEGRGFSVTQQGEALEAGAVGDWIRVRPEGTRPGRGQDDVRARIENPGRAVIPLGR
jgi:flagellar basal body P-ring formation protein FlgA